MKRLLLACLTTMLLFSAAYPQGQYQKMDKDSLLNILRSEKVDTNRIKIYLVLQDKFRISDFLVAQSYSDTAYKLSKSINWQPGIAKSALRLGTAYSLTGKADLAIELMQEAIENAQLVGDPQTEARAYMTLGNIQYDKGNYADALPFYMQCFEANKSIKDPFQKYAGMSAALIWVGIIYQYGQQDYDKAIEIYKEADEYAILGDSKLNRGYIVSNLATIYYMLDQYDSSIVYNLKSIEIKKEYNDTRGLANAYNNLGNNYFDLRNFQEASDYYLKAFDLRKSIADSTGIASSLINLGGVKYEMNQLNQSVQYYKEGLDIAERIDNKEAMQQGYQLLSQTYEKQRNFNASLQAYKKFKAIGDSIFNTESDQILSELKTKYETEKKENLIAIQEAEIANQKSTNERNIYAIIALAVTVIALVFLALLIRSRSKKKQQLLIQENELKLKETQISATISSQEKERSRFAKDLHDGFGQMISVLNLNLKSLNEDSEKSHEVFENSSQVLEDMYVELKSICFNLMPQTLIKQGIGAALKEFTNRINLSGKISVQLDLFGIKDRLPELVEISLYRITQEWVNNILKYSDATNVTVQITGDQQDLTLLIEDNGMGFDKNLLINGKGNGWNNINSRVNLIKGEIDLDTVSGRRGNTLVAELSLKDVVIEEPIIN